MSSTVAKKSQAPIPAAVLFNDKQTAAYLNISEATLRRSRMQGVRAGHFFVAYVKLGRAVRYAKADLDAWLESCRVTGNPTVNSELKS